MATALVERHKIEVDRVQKIEHDAWYFLIKCPIGINNKNVEELLEKEFNYRDHKFSIYSIQGSSQENPVFVVNNTLSIVALQLTYPVKLHRSTHCPLCGK